MTDRRERLDKIPTAVVVEDAGEGSQHARHRSRGPAEGPRLQSAPDQPGPCRDRQAARTRRTRNIKVQSTSKQLNQLATGARKVSNGAAALAKATPALTSGISTAANGAQQLDSGAGQLKTGLTSLQTGAQRLATGEKQAIVGQGQLLTGVNSLATGVTTLKTGATQLNTGLANGVKQIPNPSSDQRSCLRPSSARSRRRSSSPPSPSASLRPIRG